MASRSAWDRAVRPARGPARRAGDEAAIAVADEAQRQGLGKLLLLRLLAAAAERGIERFRCEVLCSNTSMHTSIEKVAPEHTSQTTEPAGPMYGFFRAAAQGAVEWTNWLWR